MRRDEGVPNQKSFKNLKYIHNYSEGVYKDDAPEEMMENMRCYLHALADGDAQRNVVSN